MKIITGRPCRLTEELIRRVGETIGREKRALILVPSQETLRTELQILDGLGLSGSFQLDVLSPARLRERVFERAGRPDRTVLNEQGKRMVLCGILEEERENLSVYAKAAAGGPEHLAALLSQLISCLKLSGQDPETALARAEVYPSPLREKMTELARLYAHYEARIAGRLTDAEELLFEEERRLAASAVTQGAEVFASGFDLAAPAFARQLLMLARETEVSLFLESDRNAAPDGRLFAPVNRSIERLCAAARQAGIPTERIHVTPPLRSSEAIARLESGLFALGAAPAPDAPEGIRFLTASNPLREAHLVCSDLRRRLAAGEDPATLAVQYPAGSPARALLPAVAKRYGIAVYQAEKRPAASHPLLVYLLSALQMAGEGGFRMPEFTECVKSGFAGLDRDRADRLVTYCESMQLRGYQLNRPLRYRADDSMTEEELSALEEDRKTAAEPIARFASRLRASRGRDEAIAACLTLLSEIGALRTLENMRSELTEKGFPSEAQDCAQLWNALMDTFDQLHETLPESASAHLVRRLLRSGLSALFLSAIPPAAGSVLCGAIGNLRCGRVRRLYMMGMNDMEGSEPAGFFTRRERAILEEGGVYLGPSSRETAALSQLDVLKTLSCATDTLWISCPRSDESGRALREGEAVLSLRRLFPVLPEEGGAREELRAMLSAPGPAAEAIAMHAREAAREGAGADPDFAGAAAALYATREGKQDLNAALLAMEERPALRLDLEISRALYGKTREVVSVSRLETFASCPFLYYFSYGLRPRPPRGRDADPGPVGTLMHGIMERFLLAASAHPAFPSIPRGEAEVLCREAERDLISAWRRSPYGESPRGQAMARRISRRVFRSAEAMLRQFEQEGYRPLRGEMTFGEGEIPPMILDLPDGGAVFLRGRIDRVDFSPLPEGGQVIRIVDYKSGRKKPDPAEIYCGAQLQLALYMAAALSVLPGTRPAGFCYARLADPILSSGTRDPEEARRLMEKEMRPEGLFVGQAEGKKKNGVTEEEMAAILRFARQKAAELAMAAASGITDASPLTDGKELTCSGCAARAVCGFDPARHSAREMPPVTWQDVAQAAREFPGAAGANDFRFFDRSQ